MRGHLRAGRHRRGDDGSIAVMAAVILPVVALVVLLALSTLVWGASETEVQRASDQAATSAAASAALVDFPYSSVSYLASNAYPTLTSAVPASLVPYIQSLAACGAIGDPVTAVNGLLNPGGLLSALFTSLGTGSVTGLTSAITALPASLQTALASVPTSCTGLSVLPALPAVPNPLLTAACATASKNVTDSTAPYATRFFGGDPTTGVQPNCDVNKRVQVGFGTNSPLLGFGTVASTGSSLGLQLPTGFSTVQTDLAALGVHLDTSLPNLICPQVNVEVDQPVHAIANVITTTNNGVSSATRAIKNAVVVPVFNGQALQDITGSSSATLGVGGHSSTASYLGVNQTVNAVDLQSQLLQSVQQQLLSTLDTFNTAINSALTTANAGVSVLNGTTSTVAASSPVALPVPQPAVPGNLDAANLLSCIRKTVGDLINPPTGQNAPTVDSMLSAASASGEPVMLIQVGVQACAGATSAVSVYTCLQPNLPPVTAGVPTATQKLTGLYDVPILDVTPAVVKDVGNHNYLAVPVDATQATGAFRATLVRGSNERYAP